MAEGQVQGRGCCLNMAFSQKGWWGIPNPGAALRSAPGYGNDGLRPKRVTFPRNVVSLLARLAASLCLLFLLGCQEKARNQPAPAKAPAKPPAAQKQVQIPNRGGEGLLEYPPRELPNDEQSQRLREQAQVDLKRGVDWLLAQQGEDGGWHSQTYGPFKCGAAMTALVLYAASNLPPELQQEHAAVWERGWKFLEPGVSQKGFVVCPDGTMDEPVYATALVLIANQKLHLNIEPKHVSSMRGFLIDERCAKQRGFKEDDLNYGGWDLEGGTGLQGETPGSNISVTRFAAFALADQVASQPMGIEVERWVGRVQNFPGDGGFFFHPQRDHEGNKAEWADGETREKPRSYGTATCDGVLILANRIGPGLSIEDERFNRPDLQAGIKWLVDHPGVDHVPGFKDAAPELGWRDGLLYYYLMSLAEVSKLFPEPVRTERYKQIISQLLSTQQKDGHWQNASARMREDDPLIATSFAVVALGQLLK